MINLFGLLSTDKNSSDSLHRFSSSKTLIAGLLALGLSACGGGGGGGDAPPDPAPNDIIASSTTVIRTTLTRVEDCPNGGIELDIGIDSNGDGTLTGSEIARTETICHGTAGTNGLDGINALVKFLDEPAGSNCEKGGYQVQSGLDANANAVLDASEISDSTFICNGVDATAPTYTASSASTISGNISIANASTLFQRPAPAGFAQRVTTQQGGLWLTPNDVLAAIQADQGKNNLDSAPGAKGIAPPVIAPIKIPVEADGSFSVEVPAGTDYSLIAVTADGTQGAKIDDIAVNPGSSATVNIADTDLKPSGSIRLSVIDLATTQPIDGAEVILLETGETTVTEPDGTAGFDNIPEGTFAISVRSADYISQYETVIVAASQQTDIGSVQLNKQKGSASGQIDVAGLDNLSNVPVYARSLDGDVFATLTNSSGVFQFNALPVGEGYSFIAIANDFRSSKVENISVTKGVNASVGTINLTPTISAVGSITGFAYYSERAGRPEHAGIIVSVEGTDKEGVTSRDGAFVINGLPAGSYTINYTDSNHSTTTRTVEVVNSAASNLSPVTLQARVGTISGTLLDDLGNPVGSADVLLQELGLATVTDGSGAFTFVDTPAGDYTLLIAKAGHQSSSLDVILNPEATLALGNLSINAYRFSGTVLLDGLTDHSGVVLSVTGSGQTVQSDANGDFEFIGIPAGSYQLQLTRAGYKSQSQTILIPENTTQYALSFDLGMTRTEGVVRGIATLTGQVNHAGVRVQLLGTSFATFTDATGRWEMTVPTGNYGDGIEYSRSLFGTITSGETATVVDAGEYNASPAALAQQSVAVSLGVTAINGCVNNLQVRYEGLSVGNNTVDFTTPVIGGQVSGIDLPFGDYAMTVSCTLSGWESVTDIITIEDNTLLATTLDAVNLRVRYVNINGGETVTNNANVTLDIGASDATEMRILEGVTDTGFIAFNSSYALALNAGDGSKTVTVEFRDALANPLPSVQASIDLDTTITVASFTATGATTRGDQLLLTLDIGETGATVTADVPSQINGLSLNDKGILGDPVANDGKYGRLLLIDNSKDTDAPVVAHITDRAGNTLDANSDTNLVLNTSPQIRNLRITSDIALGEMTLQFTTDEDATTVVDYGDSFTNLLNNEIVSATGTLLHNVTLTGLPANAITYLEITATDGSGNVSTQQGQGKLAPSAMTNVQAVPGNGEIAVIWPPVVSLRGYTYHVYRSTDDITYNRITDTPTAASHYLDQGVVNGQTLYYKVSVLDEDGNESVLSDAANSAADGNLAGPTVINGGFIEGEEVVWLPSLSPYQITADTHLVAHSRLRVLPGASIEVSRGIDWDIYGELWLLGEAGKEVSIISTGSGDNPAALNGQLSLGSSLCGRPAQKCFGETPVIAAGYPVLGSYMRHVVLEGYQEIKLSLMDADYVTFDYLGSSDQTSVFTSRKLDNSNFNGLLSVNADYAKNTSIISNYLGPYTNWSMRVEYGRNLTINLDAGFSCSGLADSTITAATLGSNCMLINNEITLTKTDNGASSGAIFDSSVSNFNRIQLPNWAGSGYQGVNVSQGYSGANYLGVSTWTEVLARVETASLSNLLPIVSGPDLFTADRDSDTVPDYLDYDNDNDGFSDRQEINASDFTLGVIYDPWDENSHPDPTITAKDADMDGIIDTDDADDDNDGISDADENNYGTNPYLWDSDGDGHLDNQELLAGYDPLDINNFPPAFTDTRMAPMTLDSRNLNSSGDVVFDVRGSTFAMTEFDLPQGTNLYFGMSVGSQYSMSFEATEFTSGSNNLLIWPASSNSGYVSLNFRESYLLNQNIGAPATILNGSYLDSFVENISTDADFTSSGSLITHVHAGVTMSNFLGVESSTVIRSKLNGYTAAGVGITGSMLYSSFTDSHVTFGGTVYVSGSRVKNSVLIFGSYAPTYGGDRNLVNLAIWENSLINFGSGALTSINGGYLLIRDSDVVMPNLGLAQSPKWSAALDNVAFDIQGVVLDTGYGTPVDLLGDGVIDTVITFTNINGDPQTITVDGLNNPRSTRLFPNGEADLWNPSGVGAY